MIHIPPKRGRQREGESGIFDPLLVRLSLTIMVALALFFFWIKWLPLLLNSTGFEPHGICYLWLPGLVALHVGSDSLIGVAYVSI